MRSLKGDDPLAQALKGLIDNAAHNTHQIGLLWATIEKLSPRPPGSEALSPDNPNPENFEAKGRDHGHQ